jgi:hypothetical protein
MSPKDRGMLNQMLQERVAEMIGEPVPVGSVN